MTTPEEPKKSKKKTYIITGVAAVVVLGIGSAIFGDDSEPSASTDATTTAESTTSETNTETVSSTPEAEQPNPEPAPAPEPKTVKAGESEFTCKDVPQDVIDSIMQGDKDADGANTKVLESQMVEGTSGAIFVTAKIEWYNDGNPFQATFGITNGGTGATVSATKGTAELFSWPYLETAANADAAKAVQNCI